MSAHHIQKDDSTVIHNRSGPTGEYTSIAVYNGIRLRCVLEIALSAVRLTLNTYLHIDYVWWLCSSYFTICLSSFVSQA